MPTPNCWKPGRLSIQKIIPSNHNAEKNLMKAELLDQRQKVPMELGFTNSTRSTLRNDAIRCWNKAPESIENKSLNTVKEQIKSFVKTLPI